jgi:hypothetical protein
MLLQTANSVGQARGGSASRCPPNLASIAVAVEWCNDETLDVQARCIAYAMRDPCSKQCTERVHIVKERRQGGSTHDPMGPHHPHTNGSTSAP